MRCLLPVLLTLACLLAAGCGHREDRTADGRIIVSYWEKWSDFEFDAMQAVVNDFNRSQDRIEVRILPVSQIDVKLMLAVGGNPPDLAGLWSFSVPDFAEKGALTPINGALRRKGITREQFIPVFWDLCSHRGFQWGVPTTPASLALHYNRATFREAGLDPDKPPQTLSELEELNEKLTLVELTRTGRTVRVSYAMLTPEERQARRFAIVRAGHLPQEPGWWLASMGVWFGGSLFDAAHERITAEDPGNLAALRWFRDITAKYGIENVRNYGDGGGNFASPQNPFLSGHVAMELQGVWMHNFISKYAPDLDWGVAPYPVADPVNGKDTTIVETDVLVIPRGAKHAAEAFEFMAYLCQRGPAEKLALGHRKFTPLRDVSPEFLARHPNPHIREFIRLAASPNARVVPRLGTWREYQEEMRVASDGALWHLSTPEAGLAQVQQRVSWRWGRVLERWNRVGETRRKEWQQSDLP